MELLNVHIFCRFKVVNVLEEILLAVESVDDHTIRKKRGFIIKVDFEKAYDKVDWGYFNYILQL